MGLPCFPLIIMYYVFFTSILNVITVSCVPCPKRISTNPIVSTRYGLIKGLESSYTIDGSIYSYHSFLGIPFADPPVGQKRFRPGVPFNSNWTSPYQATYFRDACVQNDQNSNDTPDNKNSEDCLYLNVWRPKLDSADQLLPVYYHIFGSGYDKNSGATPYYRGDILAASQKIITVTSNHRLGVFGFAYGSPEEMPGNIGLYDILLALQWIKDNIRSFGGDPNRVTLSGFSTGSKIATVIVSLPSKFNTRSLFSRIIGMSGASADFHQVESIEIGTAKTRLLASKVDCLSPKDTYNPSASRLSPETINCLRNQSAEVLLKAQNSPEINEIGSAAEYVFLLVHGTELIPSPPIVNIRDNLCESQDLPMLFGFQQDESKPFPTLGIVQTLQDAYNYTRAEITFALKNATTDQIDSMFEFYFKNVDPTDIYALQSQCIALTSDANFICPIELVSQLFSLASSRVYVYRNDYIGSQMSRPFGTIHGDDIIFGLGAPFREANYYSSTDREYSKFLMKLFGDWVKGIPLLDWPSVHFNASNPAGLQGIKRLSLSPKNDLFYGQNACLKWSQLFNYQITEGVDYNCNN